MMIADLTICWRLYVIWRRDLRVMILPALLVLGQLGSEGTIFVLDTIKIFRGYGDHRQAIYRSAVKASVCQSMVLNVLCTSMIVGRLWWAERQVKKSFSSSNRGMPSNARLSYIKIILALIESGSLYLVYVTMYLISMYAGDVSPGCYACTDEPSC